MTIFLENYKVSNSTFTTQISSDNGTNVPQVRLKLLVAFSCVSLTER